MLVRQSVEAPNDREHPVYPDYKAVVQYGFSNVGELLLGAGIANSDLWGNFPGTLITGYDPSSPDSISKSEALAAAIMDIRKSRDTHPQFLPADESEHLCRLIYTAGSMVEEFSDHGYDPRTFNNNSLTREATVLAGGHILHRATMAIERPAREVTIKAIERARRAIVLPRLYPLPQFVVSLERGSDEDPKNRLAARVIAQAEARFS